MLGVTLCCMEHLAWILLVALASAFGGYLGAYLKKKGENLATHEDLEKLVHQMAATTEATKAIEARISDEMWNRQRQWEMKKEIFVEATRTIAKADAVLARTVTTYLAEESLRDRLDQCEELWLALAGDGSQVMIVSSPKTITAHTDMTASFIETVLCLQPEIENRVAAREQFNDFRSRVAACYIALREELGMPLPELSAAPRSTGPSVI
jgi:hypothetical protein